MKCGTETSHRVTRTFNWVPPWIGITILAGLLIYFILAAVLRKTYTVAVPLCEDHKRHWTNRTVLTLVSLVVLVLGSIGLGVLAGNLGPAADDVGPVIVFVIIGGFVAWLVLVIVANSTAIRPEEITDDGIRLTGVCMEFSDAYREMEDREREARREARDHWDDRPRPKRRDYREDEDDRPRRRDDERYQGRADEEDRPRRKRERDPEDEY